MLYLIAPQKGTSRPDNISAPVGLCYIQAYLLKNGIDSRIVDMELTDKERLSDDIKKDKPEFVGISCFTDNRQYSFDIARLVKNLSPKTKVILGAHHATAMHRQILEKIPEVDVIVLGEGELTFLDLINTMKAGGDLSNVDSIAFRNGGTVVVTKSRTPIMKLDDMPFPSYKDLDIKMYKWNNFGVNVTNYDIVTSRGCPNACTYCSSSSFWGHTWRSRSPKNVVDEIELINKKYGIKHFRIVDDNFTAAKPRAIEICKDIINRKLKIDFWVQGRVQSLANEDDYAQWLKKAGCYLIAFGIESGSQKILDNINKRQTVQQILDACASCKKAGIKINAYFMVGNPGETWRTVFASKRIINIIKPEEMGVSITQVYPGTEMYDKTKTMLGSDDYWLTDKRPYMNTTEHSWTQLRIWQLYLLGYKYMFDKIMVLLSGRAK